ncbi:macro domain-like protein [Karstenula rhodostoma CBS 690.94]|uniref:Macro domain-like protein n=1 Tax=Karstenula rhodostoma CBS 690.94 TaxID=1392251 RepID=A0A9P4U8D3_9PLEO|nr:macro domain-like protein [Karstenula rhodostoma CBS 690.94]
MGPPPLPSIHLLCLEETHIAAFTTALRTHNAPPLDINYHHGTLASLPQTTHFDAIVSPANSYARMDGGFDDALSRALSPADDYMALTRVASEALYAEHCGFLPPGGCMLVSLEDARLRENEWGCKWLALCPTMKVPQRVEWDREVVYECVYALLAAIDRHNRRLREGKDGMAGEKVGEGREIRSVLMTPLATGYGRWSAARWAAQTVLAMKHFSEAVEAGKGWEKKGPVRVMGHVGEVEKTWDL